MNATVLFLWTSNLCNRCLFMLNIENKVAKVPFHTWANEPGISVSSSKYRTVLLNIDFVHEFSQYVNMSPLPWKEGKKFYFIGSLFLLCRVYWYIYLAFRPKSFEKWEARFQGITFQRHSITVNISIRTGFLSKGYVYNFTQE